MAKKKPENHGKQWTDDEIEKLKKLADGNTPTGIIGLKLGRTADSITSKASQQGISLQPTNQSPYDRNVSNEKKGKK
ncbi:hypothetical protein CMU76_17250 [Elizabethkingia anophelis]|nr:hypothetical protein [Elizabethkingia anophelis]